MTLCPSAMRADTHSAATTSSAATMSWPTLARSSTSTPSASAGVRIGVDPLGGGERGDYWGRDRVQRYGLDLTVVNPDVDPTVRVHDAGLGRQDPHGPARRPTAMALADRPSERFRHRHRKRHRLRPARHRHADGGLHEPEPLPGRGYRLPVRQPHVSGRCDAAIGKTLVSARHDRQGRATSRTARCSRFPSASSGSCRACSTARSASAAKRAPAHVVPAARRHDVDDRQGRPDRWRCCRLGDPRRVTGSDSPSPATTDKLTAGAWQTGGRRRVEASANARAEEAVLSKLVAGCRSSDDRNSPASRSPTS